MKDLKYEQQEIDLDGSIPAQMGLLTVFLSPLALWASATGWWFLLCAPCPWAGFPVETCACAYVSNL